MVILDQVSWPWAHTATWKYLHKLLVETRLGFQYFESLIDFLWFRV